MLLQVQTSEQLMLHFESSQMELIRLTFSILKLLKRRLKSSEQLQNSERTKSWTCTEDMILPQLCFHLWIQHLLLRKWNEKLHESIWRWFLFPSVVQGIVFVKEHWQEGSVTNRAQFKFNIMINEEAKEIDIIIML